MTSHGPRSAGPACIFIQVKPEQLIYGIVTQKRPHNLPNQVVKEQSDPPGRSKVARIIPRNCWQSTKIRDFSTGFQRIKALFSGHPDSCEAAFSDLKNSGVTDPDLPIAVGDPFPINSNSALLQHPQRLRRACHQSSLFDDRSDRHLLATALDNFLHYPGRHSPFLKAIDEFLFCVPRIAPE